MGKKVKFITNRKNFFIFNSLYYNEQNGLIIMLKFKFLKCIFELIFAESSISSKIDVRQGENVPLLGIFT